MLHRDVDVADLERTADVRPEQVDFVDQVQRPQALLQPVEHLPQHHGRLLTPHNTAPARHRTRRTPQTATLTPGTDNACPPHDAHRHSCRQPGPPSGNPSHRNGNRPSSPRSSGPGRERATPSRPPRRPATSHARGSTRRGIPTPHPVREANCGDQPIRSPHNGPDALQNPTRRPQAARRRTTPKAVSLDSRNLTQPAGPHTEPAPYQYRPATALPRNTINTQNHRLTTPTALQANTLARQATSTRRDTRAGARSDIICVTHTQIEAPVSRRTGHHGRGGCPRPARVRPAEPLRTPAAKQGRKRPSHLLSLRRQLGENLGRCYVRRPSPCVHGAAKVPAFARAIGQVSGHRVTTAGVGRLPRTGVAGRAGSCS